MLQTQTFFFGKHSHGLCIKQPGHVYLDDKTPQRAAITEFPVLASECDVLRKSKSVRYKRT